jgi:sulfofructose kinase
MLEPIDVLGLGVVAVDDILLVDEYPPPDAKVEVRRSERHCGGLTATALVAAARLGATCSYAGVLGSDELSRFVLDRLSREGIRLDHLVLEEGTGPCHSVIVVDTTRKTRNIFFEVSRARGAHPTLPAEDAIRSARVLFVDHYGTEGMIRAARIARGAGIPVVADIERPDVPRFDELLALVDHLIVSRDFAESLTGLREPAVAARALVRKGREVVAVTAGADGCWYVTGPSYREAVHQPAFRVEAVDTTGCGDVFHGAYASALARGLGLAERIRFASAAAALKAMRPGGQEGIPTRATVEGFLLA